MNTVHRRYLEYHERILRWQQGMGQDVNDPEQEKNQWKYTQSEWVELLDAVTEANAIKNTKMTLDAIGDVLFTALGMPLPFVLRLISERYIGLLFVVESLTLANNWDQFEILEAVCKSNDTKFWETVDGVDTELYTIHSANNGKFVVRSKDTNKVAKPPTFKEPDFSAILNGPQLHLPKA